MGEPPFIHAAPTALVVDAAYDCVLRTLNTGDYLLLDVNRESALVKAQAQWRGGQFGVRDFVDQFTISVFLDAQNRTIIRAAVVTTVDAKPDEPSERGIAAATDIVNTCVR